MPVATLSNSYFLSIPVPDNGESPIKTSWCSNKNVSELVTPDTIPNPVKSVLKSLDEPLIVNISPADSPWLGNVTNTLLVDSVLTIGTG